VPTSYPPLRGDVGSDLAADISLTADCYDRTRLALLGPSQAERERRRVDTNQAAPPFRLSAAKQLKLRRQLADIQPLWDTVNNYVRHSHNSTRVKIELVKYVRIWDPQFLTVRNHVNCGSTAFCEYRSRC
jgi:hypothetical protein